MFDIIKSGLIHYLVFRIAINMNNLKNYTQNIIYGSPMNFLLFHLSHTYFTLLLEWGQMTATTNFIKIYLQGLLKINQTYKENPLGNL